LEFGVRVDQLDVSLFYDNFLDGGPICEMLDYVRISDTQLLIKDVLVQCSWQWNNLATQLPTDVKDGLRYIILDGNTDDPLMWDLLLEVVILLVPPRSGSTLRISLILPLNR